MKQKLIATRSLSYATRRLQAGDEFEAPERHARILIARQRAKAAQDQREPGSLPPPRAALTQQAQTVSSAPPVPPENPEALEIPDDWRDLHHMKLIALAKALGTNAENKAEAIVVIEAELARRQSSNAC